MRACTVILDMGSLRRLLTEIGRLYGSMWSKWWTMLLCPTAGGESGAIDAIPVPMGRVPLSGIFLEAIFPVPGEAGAAPVEGEVGAANVSVGLMGCLGNYVWASYMSKFATGPSSAGMQVAGTEGGGGGGAMLFDATQQRLSIGSLSSVLLVGWDTPGAQTEGGATDPEVAFRVLIGTSDP